MSAVLKAPLVTLPRIPLDIFMALFLCLLGSLYAPAVFAEIPAAPNLAGYTKTLDSINKQLNQPIANEEILKGWIDQLATDRNAITICISDREKALAQLNIDLESLGKSVSGEATDVSRKRREVRTNLAELERQLAECRVFALRSDELSQKLRERYKAAIAELMFAHGPSIMVLLLDNWNNTVTIGMATVMFVQQHAGLNNLSIPEWLWFATLMGIAYLIGRILRMRRQLRISQREHNPDAPTQLSSAILSALSHYAPQLLSALTAAGTIYLYTYEIRPVPFINVLLYGLPMYVIALLFIHLIFTPKPPNRALLSVSDELARMMARRLRVLALLAYIGYLVFSTLFAQHLPDEAYLLVRGLYAALLFLNMIWTLWLFARMREKDELRWIGLLVSMVLVISLGAEWLGYRNLATMILRVLLGSLIAFWATLILMRLFRELYDSLETGESAWPLKLRHLLGVAAGRPVPGLVWLRLATNVLLWSLFGYTLLRIWHVSTSTIQHVEDSLIMGFPLGTFQVVPYRILMAIAIFAVLVTFARWLQTRLDRHWLRYARMDHGAREAVVTITGYVLITIAALVGLSIAGFAFGNLAIIAGALSVGIGFGLQNIVNNFISGLILLFERPVKTGDWIVVGNTEGYVKRISIRSTQIQTFDRSDVIVPNSELISQQVTNWMLYDNQGRARIPIGVAYGSDTQKVKLILEKIGRDHPSVITDGSYPEPKVLFLGFGDSALNFELRCFVRNVDNRLQVISDINFAIDAAFRAEGVEIPFPQRDLHLRSLPPGYPAGPENTAES